MNRCRGSRRVLTTRKARYEAAHTGKWRRVPPGSRANGTTHMGAPGTWEALSSPERRAGWTTGLTSPRWARHAAALRRSRRKGSPIGTSPTYLTSANLDTSMTFSSSSGGLGIGTFGIGSFGVGGMGMSLGLPSGGAGLGTVPVGFTAALNGVQFALDIPSLGLDATGFGGFVSGVPDLANAGISLMRGDRSGAGQGCRCGRPFHSSAQQPTARELRGQDSAPGRAQLQQRVAELMRTTGMPLALATIQDQFFPRVDVLTLWTGSEERCANSSLTIPAQCKRGEVKSRPIDVNSRTGRANGGRR